MWRDSDGLPDWSPWISSTGTHRESPSTVRSDLQARLRWHHLATQLSGMAARKLREGGGTNGQRDMRFGMHHRFTSGPLPSLTCLHIERVCDIGGNSCREQCSGSFRRRNVDLPVRSCQGQGRAVGQSPSCSVLLAPSSRSVYPGALRCAAAQRRLSRCPRCPRGQALRLPKEGRTHFRRRSSAVSRRYSDMN